MIIEAYDYFLDKKTTKMCQLNAIGGILIFLKRWAFNLLRIGNWCSNNVQFLLLVHHGTRIVRFTQSLHCSFISREMSKLNVDFSSQASSCFDENFCVGTTLMRQAYFFRAFWKIIFQSPILLSLLLATSNWHILRYILSLKY